VGKTTICRAVARSLHQCSEVVSTTTRSPREGEVDGVDYHFLSREEGETALAEGRFVEHVIYDGNLYGFLRDSFDSEDKLVLVAERHGMEQLKKIFPSHKVQAVLVLPPSLEALEARLTQGGRDEATIKRRLATAEEEIFEGILEFDHVIMNQDLDLAVKIASLFVESFNPEGDQS
jgi:guanylate kinase